MVVVEVFRVDWVWKYSTTSPCVCLCVCVFTRKRLMADTGADVVWFRFLQGWD